MSQFKFSGCVFVVFRKCFQDTIQFLDSSNIFLPPPANIISKPSICPYFSLWKEIPWIHTLGCTYSKSKEHFYWVITINIKMYRLFNTQFSKETIQQIRNTAAWRNGRCPKRQQHSLIASYRELIWSIKVLFHILAYRK